MPIPDITHLQYLVLQIIGAGERPGSYVRDRLEAEGQRKSLPAFYQMMSRLEDAGLVKGTNYKIEVEGQPVTERRYKVTAAGHRASREVLEFYSTRSIAGGVVGQGGVS